MDVGLVVELGKEWWAQFVVALMLAPDVERRAESVRLVTQMRHEFVRGNSLGDLFHLGLEIRWAGTLASCLPCKIVEHCFQDLSATLERK